MSPRSIQDIVKPSPLGETRILPTLPHEQKIVTKAYQRLHFSSAVRISGSIKVQAQAPCTYMPKFVLWTGKQLATSQVNSTTGSPHQNSLEPFPRVDEERKLLQRGPDVGMHMVLLSVMQTEARLASTHLRKRMDHLCSAPLHQLLHTYSLQLQSRPTTRTTTYPSRT